jgi:hypothetical protein
MTALISVLAIVATLALIGVPMSVRTIQQYEEGVLFRFGRVVGVNKPGLRSHHPAATKAKMKHRGAHVLVAAAAALAGLSACGHVQSHNTGIVAVPRTVPGDSPPISTKSPTPYHPPRGPGPATRTSGVDPLGGVTPPGQPPGESGTRTP